MLSLQQKLTSEVSGIILKYVKGESGRLTWISEATSINRKEFTRKGMAKMKLHRLLRVLYALTIRLDEKEYDSFLDELENTIIEFADTYDERLLTGKNPIGDVIDFGL